MLATGHTTGSPVKSQHNPFRRSADGPSLGAAQVPPQIDLDTRPTSLERSPSPVDAPSRSTSPEPSQSPTPATNAIDTSSNREDASASQRTYDPPPGPPPGQFIVEAISEELPPAYTPTADVHQGETSVEFGPRRPFTTAPARGATPYAVRQTPQRAGWQPMSTANPAWSAYPGTVPVRRAPPAAPLIHIDPPPQHPRLQRSVSPNGGTVRVPRIPARPLSDFARDFYTAAPAGEGAAEGSSAGNGSPVSPQDRPTTPPRPAVQDDGRPTKNPVPGHPLLNSGKVLVYPAGYECAKCHNTGYKHLDPSNPCTKCWAKYAKAYAGPLTYAPWKSSTSAPNTSHANLNLQRPLPSSAPPHSRSLTDLAASRSAPHPDLGRAASTSRQYAGAGYAGSSPYAQPRAASATAPANGGWPPASWTTPSPSPTVARTFAGAPPPGATVVSPGDPRIGGRMCWRCGGSGVTSLFIFDEQTCTVCNGLGRTF